jgi:hypothetical protein
MCHRRRDLSRGQGALWREHGHGPFVIDGEFAGWSWSLRGNDFWRNWASGHAGLDPRENLIECVGYRLDDLDESASMMSLPHGSKP